MKKHLRSLLEEPTKPSVQKTSRCQISLTIASSLLEKVNALALELGQTRSAVINMALYDAVEHRLLSQRRGRKDP